LSFLVIFELCARCNQAKCSEVQLLTRLKSQVVDLAQIRTADRSMVAYKDEPYAVETAPSSRSHCLSCKSKQGEEEEVFIKKGCVRVKEYKTSP
jgi:hypothetical protein